MFLRLKVLSIALGLVIILIGIGTTNAYAAVGVTMTTDPPGRSYVVDGITRTTPIMFLWEPGEVHFVSVTSPQISGSNRFVFTSWSDGGEMAHSFVVPSGIASTSLIAAFQAFDPLTVSGVPANGGTVTADPPSSDGYYPRYSAVSLLAAPNPGYLFLNWNGNPDDTENPKSVSINGPRTMVAVFQPAGHQITLGPGGAAQYETSGTSASFAKSGYAKLVLHTGTAPYGNAVIIYKQNGVTVSEAGVPASPPTTHARIFIDLRNDALVVPGRSNSGTVDINTGISIVNCGTDTANISYTLYDANSTPIAASMGTLSVNRHFAKFIDQFNEVAGFVPPSDFHFGSLDIVSDQPVSIIALRMTISQRGEALFTTTPVADYSQPSVSDPIYFPQIADGAGYTTSLILLNTSGSTQRGTIQLIDDSGNPFVVHQVGGSTGSSFSYTIPANGIFRFQTDGASQNAKGGWAKVTPTSFTTTPIGSAIFSYNPADVLLTESGVPSVVPATHARIYLDLTQNHNTGLAISNLSASSSAFALQAFQADGTTLIDSSPNFQLPAQGHTGQFATQFLSHLPAEFMGILDVSSTTPFAALTLRSLTNERGDFLITTFPTADTAVAAKTPIVFPHIADGGGYTTQFILISPGAEADAFLLLYDDAGQPFEIN
jgi:hypothetical protein